MDTIFDFVSPFEEFLTMISRYGIEAGDARFFPAYREFLRMRAERHTYYASLETVSERFSLPVGTLRRKFRKFSQRLRE